MKDKLSKVSVKSAVCAAAAMLLLMQPAWGSGYTTTPEVSQTKADSGKKVTNRNIPAGAALSSEQAEQVVKKLFPVLGKAKVTNVEYREANQVQSGMKVWDLYLTIRNEGMYTGISAGVNAVTGEIVHIHLPRELYQSADPEGAPELSREEAGVRGLEWVRQNIRSIQVDGLSERTDQFVNYKSLFSPLTYEFYYNLPMNGFPSDADTIQFTVDSYGNLISFSRTKMNVKAVTPKTRLSAQEMRKKIEDMFTAELAYVPTHLNSDLRDTYYLAYLPPESVSSAFDAGSGARLNYNGNPDKNVNIAPVPVKSSQAVFKASPKPLGSSEQALKWAESQVVIPKGFKADFKSLNSHGPGKNKLWRISWIGPKPEKGYKENISVELDAQSGQIHSYNRYTYHSQEDKKGKSMDVTAAKARQTAIELAARLVPGAEKEWKLTRVSSDGDYSFIFSRYAAGILIYGEHLSVTLARDGTLKQFNCFTYTDPARLPLDTKAKISVKEAKAAYMHAMDLQLKYAQFGGYDSTIAKLVYTVKHKLTNSYSGLHLPLDAVTGEWREFHPVSTAQAKPAVDTKGHKYQTALDKLVRFGVLRADKEGKVYPDQEMTTGDWYLMAARALNSQADLYPAAGGEPYGVLQPESPYYQAVMSLVYQGWLPSEPEADFSTDRKLTRDDVGLLLTRMLKYEKLSRSFTETDVVPGAGDAAEIKNRGAAIIAVKLGLMPVIDGKFMPKHVLTRGEAAEILVRLSAMVGKSDSFMNHSYGH